MKVFNVDQGYIEHYKQEYYGGTVLFMHKHGDAFFRVYWYDNKPDSIYLSGVSVSKDCRNQGIGNWILHMFEQIGRSRKATKLCLCSKTDSFAYEWYKRNGYKDFDYVDPENAEELNYTWMKKELNYN
jgi:ribosomal protein S18 acetylase RimI-like enzyme